MTEITSRVHLTPMQLKIVTILADGEPHKRTDIKEQLDDQLMGNGTVSVHMTNIRNKIARLGYTILAEPGYHPTFHQRFRLVKLVGKAYERAVTTGRLQSSGA